MAGLSLGLVYPPSAYTDEGELLALAETVKAHGKILAADIRSYEAGFWRVDRVPDQTQWTLAGLLTGLLMAHPGVADQELGEYARSTEGVRPCSMSASPRPIPCAAWLVGDRSHR